MSYMWISHLVISLPTFQFSVFSFPRLVSSAMASLSASSIRFGASSLKHTSAVAQVSFLKLNSVGWANRGFSSLRRTKLRVSCSAKPETVEKVCEIVRKQLALAADTDLTPDSKFSALGADSLDTVEIVMELEEAFGISVEEESSNSITTIQEAADMIEKLVQKEA